MKKNNAVIALGVLFGLGLIGVGFAYFVLSIALAFVNHGWFIYVAFAMGALALVAIVGSCFARSKICVSRITLGIALIGYIASIICLFALVGFSMGLLPVLLLAVLILGVVAFVLTFLIKESLANVTASESVSNNDSNPPVSE